MTSCLARLMTRVAFVGVLTLSPGLGHTQTPGTPPPLPRPLPPVVENVNHVMLIQQLLRIEILLQQIRDALVPPTKDTPVPWPSPPASRDTQ